MNDTDHRLPRYQRLRDQIAREIARKVWRPGQAIPTETELAASHGIAIGTVRRAIDMLVADGLVERSQGRGTFVRRPSFGNSLLRFLRHHGPEGVRQVPESRILGLVEVAAPAEPAAKLGMAPGVAALRMARLRLIDGRVVLVEDIWLPKARFAKLLGLAPADFGQLLYPVYEEVCGEIIASAEETLTVEALDADNARLLGQPEGSPAVVIERLALDHERHPVEWRRSRAPGATFRYKIDIR